MNRGGDDALLSSGRSIGPLACAVLLLMLLAPLAKQPLAVDRLGDLAQFLGDSTEKEASLRMDAPGRGNTPSRARSDSGSKHP